MSIKCIALDLDRTTLTTEGRLSDGNRRALEYAINKGIHIVVASGRAFDTLPKDVMAVPGIEYAVTSNGAAVYHVPTGRCMVEYNLPQEVPGKVLELTKGIEHISYECFIHGKAFGGQEYLEDPAHFGASEQSVRYMKETRTLVPDIRAFILEHAHELNSMDVLVPDMKVNLQIQEIIRRNLTYIYMTSSFFQLVELANKECGKANGLRHVARILGIEREELAAFGDAGNDSEMLAYAGTGIAMENASADCKEAADHITKHHDDDGVAWGIMEILKL